MEISIFEATIKDFTVYGRFGIINLVFLICEYISVVLIFSLIIMCIFMCICHVNYFGIQHNNLKN